MPGSAQVFRVRKIFALNWCSMVRWTISVKWLKRNRLLCGPHLLAVTAPSFDSENVRLFFFFFWASRSWFFLSLCEKLWVWCFFLSVRWYLEGARWSEWHCWMTQPCWPAPCRKAHCRNLHTCSNQPIPCSGCSRHTGQECSTKALLCTSWSLTLQSHCYTRNLLWGVHLQKIKSCLRDPTIMAWRCLICE